MFMRQSIFAAGAFITKNYEIIRYMMISTFTIQTIAIDKLNNHFDNT